MKMRRIDWARVKERVKQSDSSVMTVVTFGTRIHRRIIVIERENDGMLSPRFGKRQALDKDMGIGSYGLKLIRVVLASCIQWVKLGTAWEGKVIHGSFREVGSKHNLRCKCADMHRAVALQDGPSSLAILNK